MLLIALCILLDSREFPSHRKSGPPSSMLIGIGKNALKLYDISIKIKSVCFVMRQIASRARIMAISPTLLLLDPPQISPGHHRC